MTVVLSGTARVVLSGTRESSDREPGSLTSHENLWKIQPPSNDANKESFGLLLTEALVSIGRVAL
jgi:hypothetical protein